MLVELGIAIYLASYLIKEDETTTIPIEEKDYVDEDEEFHWIN